jgi:3D (Asp-Asp-Asp) domain-containing protein
VGNFVQNTGNLLKSLLTGAGDTFGRGVEVVSDYLRKPQGDVTSDYLVSPVPERPMEAPRIAAPAQPQPQPSQFDRLTYYLPTGNPTSTGTTPRSGYTAAISRQLLGDIPMGTLIQLPNGQVVRVEDVTDDDILGTLDIFYNNPQEATYPQGMERNVPFNIVGRDTEGLKYNF